MEVKYERTSTTGPTWPCTAGYLVGCRGTHTGSNANQCARIYDNSSIVGITDGMVLVEGTQVIEAIIAFAVLVGTVIGGLVVRTFGKSMWTKQGQQIAKDKAAHDTLKRMQDGIDAQNNGRTSGDSNDERVRNAKKRW